MANNTVIIRIDIFIIISAEAIHKILVLKKLTRVSCMIDSEGILIITAQKYILLLYIMALNNSVHLCYRLQTASPTVRAGSGPAFIGLFGTGTGSEFGPA